MIEYLRLARRLQLKALSGQVEMEENWQALEAAELRDRNGGLELVVVDTCIWVQFLNRPQSRDKKELDALLDDDRVVLIGSHCHRSFARFSA